MMDLSNLQFIKLLPQWMRGDVSNIGMCKAIDDLSQQVSSRIRLLSTWDVIDELDDSELDEIAWEFNLLWYDAASNIDTKRDLIKKGLEVWSKTGTKWAVETVARIYFGECYVREWFEYNGVPGHFAIYSNNPQLADNKVQELMVVLADVKRHSSKLDGIYITLAGDLGLHAGMRMRDTAKEQYKIGMEL